MCVDVFDVTPRRGEPAAVIVGSPRPPALVDVTDGYGDDRLVADTIRDFGRLDVLVNTAGVGQMVVDVTDTSDELVNRGRRRPPSAPAGTRGGPAVERGDRLVEDEQLGPLGEAKGESQLGALAARQPPRPLPGIETELPDPLVRQRFVPARVEASAQPDVIGDAQIGDSAPHPSTLMKITTRCTPGCAAPIRSGAVRSSDRDRVHVHLR